MKDIIESLLGLTVVLISIAGAWKVYSKAGEPGWGVLIPLYNYIVLLEIIGSSILWVLPLFIPILNIVVIMVLFMKLAKCFGKSSFFGIGLFFLPFIFFPILGFDNSVYTAPQKESTS